MKTETVNVGGGSAVLRATVTGTGLGRNLVITSMPHPDLPATIAAPPTPVYQYLSITSSTITGVVNQTTLDFSVPQAWLTDHGFEQRDIVMLHYVNGTWQALNTEFISQNGGTVLYRATTPSLSYFAIAYQQDSTLTGIATLLPTPVAVATDSVQQTPLPVNSPSQGMIVRKDTQAPPPAPVAVPDEGLPLATIIAGGHLRSCYHRWPIPGETLVDPAAEPGIVPEI